MKNITLTALLLWSAALVQAQGFRLDSLDNILLKIPRDWKVNKRETFTEMTHFNKVPNSFCMVAVYQQQPSSGDKLASFRKEWEELMLAYFETSTVPEPKTKKFKSGLTAQFVGAQAVNKTNQLPYYVELYVFDFGNTVQSVLVTLGAKKHVSVYDSLWQPIMAGATKRTNNTTQPTATASTTINNPFTGLWAKSQSSPFGVDPGTLLTNVGYMKGQYNFKPDGTYTLHGESWGGTLQSNNYTVLEESGTYKVSSNQLVISPSKSRLISTDRDGNTKKTQNLDASKRAYAWKLHYFEGLDETQLVLTPSKEYFQDGGFGSNEMFPNSYLYSTKYKPEWRITPK